MIEVGANEGYHTIFAAMCVGPTGRIVAYEPGPNQRARLEENVCRNSLKGRIEIRAAALADKVGEATFRIPADNEWNQGTGAFEQVYDSMERTRSISVKVSTLDQDVGSEDCSLLKMDVQGAEAMVLRGGFQLLKRCLPIVYFEATPGDPHVKESMELLQGLGYRVRRVTRHWRSPYHRLEPPESAGGLNCLALYEPSR